MTRLYPKGLFDKLSFLFEGVSHNQLPLLYPSKNQDNAGYLSACIRYSSVVHTTTDTSLYLHRNVLFLTVISRSKFA